VSRLEELGHRGQYCTIHEAGNQQGMGHAGASRMYARPRRFCVIPPESTDPGAGAWNPLAVACILPT
jgi:hypothetical protein